jgi:hypothetical protein
MKLGDGISRRLGTKLGNASVLVILTKFHYLLYFEEWPEKEQSITSRTVNRTRDLLNTR